jgi:hypothetical protein
MIDLRHSLSIPRHVRSWGSTGGSVYNTGEATGDAEPRLIGRLDELHRISTRCEAYWCDNVFVEKSWRSIKHEKQNDAATLRSVSMPPSVPSTS